MKHILFLICGIALLSCTACHKQQEEPLVEIQTTEGSFIVKLYKETPAHRDNFVKLVEDDFFDNILFHKVLKDYLMQTGDPNSRNADKNRMLGTGGTGYTIPAEINSSLFHRKGALSAARLPDSQNPNKESNGCQFFIITGQKFSKADLDTLELDDYNRKLDIIWQKLIIANRHKIDLYSLQINDKKKLASLQDSLVSLAEKQISQEKLLHFSPEQRKIYTTEGGVPAMDGDYTVFGQIVKGLDVIDRINQCAVNVYNRPQKDVRIIKARLIDNE